MHKFMAGIYALAFFFGLITNYADATVPVLSSIHEATDYQSINIELENHAFQGFFGEIGENRSHERMENDINFQSAVNELIDFEGGYVNDGDDSGGETKFGISKRSYPHLDIKNFTKDEAKKIYYRDFWLKGDYGRITDGRLASKMLSLAVHIGPRNATLLLQRAIQALGISITQDGYLGPITLHHTIQNSNQLLTKLKIEAANYYWELVSVKPSLEKFLSGWIVRAFT
jgi:hypothetical protein